MAYEKTNWTSTTPINVTNLNKIEDGIVDMVNTIYPIGSIYMSVNSINPQALFGGTWEQIKDTFLLSAGDTYTAGTTGGEAEHILTTAEMPSHNHKLYEKGGGSDRFLVTKTWVSSTMQAEATSGSSIGNEGGNQPHNNMPPYLTVYMWKRTA